KLDVRKRKQASLPADSEWRNTKYDPAFEHQIMSEDEYETEEKKTFISHAPHHCSDILQSLFDNVDAVVDPNAPVPGYIPRIRGEKKEVPLHITHSIAGCSQRWMVDTNWLQTHPESDTPCTLADNGKAWGDPMDPEEIEDQAKDYAKEK
ncbi:hypothetical protein BT96DRAFT_768046, partial [Gymnopus androsaceus JB14]